MSIQVRNLRKAFGDFLALDDVSLEVPGGELVALLALVTLLAKSLVEWKFQKAPALEPTAAEGDAA